MKNNLLFFLFIISCQAMGQKSSTARMVNKVQNDEYSWEKVHPPTNRNFAFSTSESTPLAEVKNASIEITYFSFEIPETCYTISEMAKTLDNDVHDYMIPFVAKNYTVRHTTDLAKRIIADAEADKHPLLGKSEAEWINNEPFAQDLRLFKKVRQSEYNTQINQSADTEIPIDVVENYPLLLCNNQQAPKVIAQKTMKIK